MVRQCGSGANAGAGPAVVAEHAVRRAPGRARTNRSLVVGPHPAGSSPASAKTARARPYQVVSPAAVPW